MEEADESLRNGMIYCCWQTHSLMLSFSLFPALLHTLILLLPKSTEILFCSICLFSDSRCPSDSCVAIFVPFEQMSLPSVLSNDRLFQTERPDAGMYRTEKTGRLTDAVSSRFKSIGNRVFNCYSLLCYNEIVVFDNHYMTAFVICSVYNNIIRIRPPHENLFS